MSADYKNTSYLGEEKQNTSGQSDRMLQYERFNSEQNIREAHGYGIAALVILIVSYVFSILGNILSMWGTTTSVSDPMVNFVMFLILGAVVLGYVEPIVAIIGAGKGNDSFAQDMGSLSKGLIVARFLAWMLISMNLFQGSGNRFVFYGLIVYAAARVWIALNKD